MNENRSPAEIKRLVQTLKKELSAEVDVERVPSPDPWPNRFRIAVVSSRFEKMTHLKRQDLVWEIVDRVLEREQSLAVSMILAYSPSEMAPAFRQKKKKAV